MKNLLRSLVVAASLLPAIAPAHAEEAAPLGLKAFELGGDNWAEAGALLEKAALHPAGLLVIRPDAPPAELPAPVPPHLRVLDMRYGEGITLIRGNHPRIEGIWPQYGGLSTGLRQNVIISDVIRPDAQVYNWKSKKKDYSPLAYKDTSEYANNHNHYQNLLSEVWNFNEHVNSVAIWGDSAALAQNAKTWGAFFSARSWPITGKYVPAGRDDIDPAKFDAQLIGVEVDVLNHGRPADKAGALSKTGVQIVGFGKTNTQAIEIRSEDTEAPDWRTRRGTWTTALMIDRSLHPQTGRVVWGTFEHGHSGIDFDMPLFKAGALRFRSEGAGQGIVVNGGRGGQIYADADNVLTVGGATGGLRLAAADGRPVLAVDAAGGVTLAAANGRPALAVDPSGGVTIRQHDRPILSIDAAGGIALAAADGRPALTVAPSGAVTVLGQDGKAAFGVAPDGSLFAGKRSLAYALVRDALRRHPLALAVALGGGLVALLALQALVAVVVVKRLRAPTRP